MRGVTRLKYMLSLLSLLSLRAQRLRERIMAFPGHIDIAIREGVAQSGYSRIRIGNVTAIAITGRLLARRLATDFSCKNSDNPGI